MGKHKRTSAGKMISFIAVPKPLPTVPLERRPRRAQQTDEQYAAEWEMNKRTHRRWVVMLSLFQAMGNCLWLPQDVQEAAMPPQAPLHRNTAAGVEGQLSNSPVSLLRYHRYGRTGP